MRDDELIDTLHELLRERDELFEQMKRRVTAGATVLPLLEKKTQEITAVVAEFRRYPPHLTARHADQLPKFHGGGDYNRSVFIMTKFPDSSSKAAPDLELQAVIDAVMASLGKHDLVGRIASQRDYHASLWDNVELHLLGCHRGIAIVEDKYAPELNPNVAMEWGVMRALGRPVLFLVEKDFVHLRADWSGLTRYTFDWADPGPLIEDAIAKWLK